MANKQSFLVVFLLVAASNFLGTVKSQRPGTCPLTGPPNGAMQCNYDAMCPNGQKCCPIGATTFYYCATPISGTSASTKPGTCPAVPSGSTGICITGCTNDQSCSGNSKCCSNGCGRVCTAPASISTGTKPGICPYSNSAAAFCGGLTRYCNSDANCGGSLKCCQNSCTMQCMNPISGNTGGSGIKQGQCPMMTPYQGGCTNQCTQDYNCYGQQKCCRNNCANICINPTFPYGK